MEEPDVNNYLLKENLFDLFKAQLKKDFESSGINGDFTDGLSTDFQALKDAVITALWPLLRGSSSGLSALLYRIDINEHQLNNYQQEHSSMQFQEVLAELIIKRILQKVILKKTFSK
jgi:hypothetical protein